MALIILQANGGEVTVFVTMNTRCAWQFYYNDHLFTDLKQNDGQKSFTMPLGTPSSNRGFNAASFYLTNFKAEAEPYQIVIAWQQAGQVVKTVTLTDADPDARPIPGDGSPNLVSELLIYQVIQLV